MQIIRHINVLRKAVAELKKEGCRIAFVPTMGALHAGHMALVTKAQQYAEAVVVSIFVNPTQFGPDEDLNIYPRREKADADMLEKAGCTLVWAPDVATMYPEGFATTIKVSGISENFEGIARPGHFDGVTTVVAKLFAQVLPDFALFGEKDYQQLAVIRKMVRDLDFPVEIIGVPTQRDTDGLALSSRNAYLSEKERIVARTLPQALNKIARTICTGGSVEKALMDAKKTLLEAGFDRVDYIALCDADTLEPLDIHDRPARILAAVHIGKTRLIDTISVLPPA